MNYEMFKALWLESRRSLEDALVWLDAVEELPDLAQKLLAERKELVSEKQKELRLLEEAGFSYMWEQRDARYVMMEREQVASRVARAISGELRKEIESEENYEPEEEDWHEDNGPTDEPATSTTKTTSMDEDDIPF